MAGSTCRPGPRELTEGKDNEGMLSGSASDGETWWIMRWVPGVPAATPVLSGMAWAFISA